MGSLQKRLFAALCAAALVVACSSPPPPREGPPQPTGSAVVVLPSDGGQLTPVPAPSGVVGRARLKSAAQTAKTIGDLVGTPGQTVEQVVRGIVMELLGRRGVRIDIDPGLVAEQVALDGPIDLLVAFSEEGNLEPAIAVSVPLRSLNEATTKLAEGLAQAGPGTWKLTAKRPRGACIVTRAAGPGGGRLICGASERDVTALGPYMARTLAAEAASGPDLVAEVDVAAIDARFGPELRKLLPILPGTLARRLGKGNPIFDKAISDGGKLVGEEAARLLGDVDKIRVELGVDPTAGLELRGETTFRAKSSWIARTTFATPAGPAPALFWKGPKEATSGMFTTMADPASYADGVKVAKELVIGALADAKVGNDAERKKVAALLDLPLKKGTTITMYGGSARVTKPAEPKSAKERWQRAFGAMSGWSLLGTSLKPDEVSTWLKAAVAAYNQPGVQKAVKAAAGDLTVSMKTGKAPAKLGDGATAIEVRMQSKFDKSDATLHVLVASSPDGAWIASGFEPDELVERLARAKEGKESLADRADLAPMKKATATTGYFFSAAAFKSSVMPFMMLRAAPAPGSKTKPEDEVLAAAETVNGLFDTLPSKGSAPAFLQSSASGDAKPTARVSVAIPKATLADLSALARAVAPR